MEREAQAAVISRVQVVGRGPAARGAVHCFCLLPARGRVVVRSRSSSGTVVFSSALKGWRGKVCGKLGSAPVVFLPSKSKHRASACINNNNTANRTGTAGEVAADIALDEQHGSSSISNVQLDARHHITSISAITRACRYARCFFCSRLSPARGRSQFAAHARFGSGLAGRFPLELPRRQYGSPCRATPVTVTPRALRLLWVPEHKRARNVEPSQPAARVVPRHNPPPSCFLEDKNS